MKKLIITLLLLFNFINNSYEINLTRSTDLNDTNPEILGGLNHNCYRECKKNEKKICYYQFFLTQDTAMSYPCKNCPFKIEDCYLKGCITAGGHVRSVTVVNHMLPGPSIEVNIK